MSPPRPALEVADILRRYGEQYRCVHALSSAQEKVLRHLVQCRTAALGGHRDTCDACGHVRISYNSCRDRHCPKCQSLKQAEWLEARRRRLLPVPYFHVVFTLPDALYPIALQNKRLVFHLLFDAATSTLQDIARDPRHLGAELGLTAILHTWGQKLQFHPHLHCVVTSGGLSADGKRWISGSDKFLFPVKVLARLFRGRFLYGLELAHREGRLKLAGSTAHLAEPRTWRRLRDSLYRLDWVVYAKPPFGGADHVFRYLGRYTHRVAISNHRLQALRDHRVTFTIRDYANGGIRKPYVLDALEFIRRFLLHVLPRRFVRIRHYGLLAGRNVETKLARALRLLEVPEVDQPLPASAPNESHEPWWERLLRLTGVDLMICPACRNGRLLRTPLHCTTPSRCQRPPPIFAMAETT